MIRENVPLAPLTYYKIGGPARFYAEPQNEKDLIEIRNFLKEKEVPFFILGAGSNVLIGDDGFQGLVIHCTSLDRTLRQSGEILEVGASLKVIEVLRHCMNGGHSGLELLVGIPGNMGGVFAMNAGTKLGEIKDVLLELTTFDLTTGKKRTILKNEMAYSYRRQNFLKKCEIILCGKLQTQPAEPKTVQNKVQELLAQRKRSQPIDKPSCGSVFKNPDPAQGIFAWKLIDEAGLRGFKCGKAQISEMHSNFIVNLGGAKASDVLGCITEAKKRVHEKFGITLEEEVQIVR